VSTRITTSRAPVPGAAGVFARVIRGRAKRENDERECGEPHRQQQPVLNLPPPHRLIRNPPHEHQRWKTDDLLLLTLSEMEQHGYRETRERDEEERR
jgi:hypothetical protein